ncbi:hypothetical protein ANN_27491 [Periplaneta americana]|uniref:Uncharacterized protein n=1 Tax=Periplaneta americana TaxID=6978 RepID=A0ABQ8RWD9_PERAM|nr:hypothetical protein ANN_27491 [Periplaneta americana]
MYSYMARFLNSDDICRTLEELDKGNEQEEPIDNLDVIDFEPQHIKEEDHSSGSEIDLDSGDEDDIDYIDDFDCLKFFIGKDDVTLLLFSQLSEDGLNLTDEINGDHECGFRRNRSTIYHIFLYLTDIGEKWEYKSTTSVIHRFQKGILLLNILIEFGIPKKLVQLIKKCLSETYSTVHDTRSDDDDDDDDNEEGKRRRKKKKDIDNDSNVNERAKMAGDYILSIYPTLGNALHLHQRITRRTRLNVADLQRDWLPEIRATGL